MHPQYNKGFELQEKNKRYPLQIICNSEEEREQLKKALLLLKSKTGERTAQALIKYFEEEKKCI